MRELSRAGGIPGRIERGRGRGMSEGGGLDLRRTFFKARQRLVSEEDTARRLDAAKRGQIGIPYQTSGAGNAS